MVDLGAIRPSQATRPIRERERAAAGTPAASDADTTAPQDRVTISAEARGRADAPGRADEKKDGGKVSADGKPKTEGKLTAEQQRRVAWLQQRDVHVRQHEAAHQAAGGSLTGGATFSYEVGPDGRSYAVGGEVPVRLATGRTPDETIANARQARRAALAPADPSPADLSVAASATEMEQAALARKARLAGQAYGKHKRVRDGQDGAAVGATAQAAYDGSLQSPGEAALQDPSEGGPQAGATRVAA